MITEAYRQEQARLHATGTYGTAGRMYGRVISDLVDIIGAKTLLDYGCGSRRSLLETLDCDVAYNGYDPAVPDYSEEPEPADLVVCIDVLEHIEPEHLNTVLDHLRSKTLKAAFLTVHDGPALKTLSDGRNAHLIQEPPRWWLPKIMDRWELKSFSRRPNGFVVTLGT